MVPKPDASDQRFGDLGIVIFDMDGTLVESMDLYADTFCQVLRHRNGISANLSRSVFLNTAGLPLDRQFELSLQASGPILAGEVDALVADFWRRVEGRRVGVSTNAAEVLRELSSAGYTLVVSSSSIPSVVLSRLRAADLERYFRLMLGTDYKSTTMVKGEGHFRLIRDELGVPAGVFRRVTAMVGDGPHDIVLAQKAGILSIVKITDYNSVFTEEARADYYIEDLAGLLPLLSRSSETGRVFTPVSKLARHSTTR